MGVITSLANARVRRVVLYQKKRRERDRDGIFVAEGERLVTEAPDALLKELYVSASYRAAVTAGAERFLALHANITETVSDEVFARMSGTKTPQGILAVVEKPAPDAEAVLTGESGAPDAKAIHTKDSGIPVRMSDGEVHEPVAASGENAGYPVIVLEGIQDPGNLGTILRISEAAGARAVILCDGTADLYNPKTVRATMGSIFRVPVFTASEVCCIMHGTEAGYARKSGAETCPVRENDIRRDDVSDIKALLAVLREKGYTIAAADMGGKVCYDAYDWRRKTALVIGNEANGLSEAARMSADETLSIPMTGKNESLNAAVSAAVLLFEAARQRRILR